MTHEVLVLGARQYAAVFVDAFDGVGGRKFSGFVENLDRALCAESILGLPVHWIDDIDPFAATHAAICCLGTTLRREFVLQVAARGFDFVSLVHPMAHLSGRAHLGAGSSIDAGAVVAGFASIGAHVRIGRGALIGHHTRVGEFSTVHPGVNVAGCCEIGSQVTLGLGAIVLDNMRIGDGAFVAAGSMVTRHVPPGALVAGSPARVVRVAYGPR